MLFRLCPIQSGIALLLDKPVLLLGRHPECDGRFNSMKVSRRHCCIAQLDDGLVVRDLGSLNGTRINGLLIREAILREGDELAIANIRFRLESVPLESPRPAPAAPPPAAAPPPGLAPGEPTVDLVPLSDDALSALRRKR